MSITSFEVLCDYFCVSWALSDCPYVSAGAYLKNDFIERTPWWTKHHMAHAGIEYTTMTRTHEVSTRRIEIHGAPRV
jgi:hypothetical protein